MKKISILLILMYLATAINAQTYPQPEFSNEVYNLKKDSAYSLTRLEKNSSKLESKTGFGSYENSYSVDGEKSPVRLGNGNNLSFVFSTGNSGVNSARSDSVLQANGISPSMTSGFTDPSNMITLYQTETGKGKRKIILQRSGSALPWGKHKSQSSDKYTFSLKKIREGYWVLVIDKQLPKGEYAFTMTGMMGGTDPMNGTTMYMFGVD